MDKRAQLITSLEFSANKKGSVGKHHTEPLVTTQFLLSPTKFHYISVDA